MSMITEQVEYLIKLSNKHPYDSNILTLQRACKEAAKTIEQLAAKVRNENGFIFPENATNGDVLKRLLYGKAIITEFIHDVNISVNNTVVGQFDMEWWNSPYKRGETE